MSVILSAYHRTEEVTQDGRKFVAKVQILSDRLGDLVDTRIRDDDHLFATREEAVRREVQLAAKWQHKHAPDAAIRFRN